MSGESTFNNVDDFDKIPDFAAAYKLMVAWGVNPTGVKDKKEAVRRLIEHWLAQKQRNDGDDTVRPNNSDINLVNFFSESTRRECNVLSTSMRRHCIELDMTFFDVLWSLDYPVMI